MRPLPVRQSQTLSRRAFVPGLMATAIGGSALAALVVGGNPRLMVVGEEEWQIGLLLASRTRVLILTGELSREAMAAIPMLLSVMRQRIDVVMGSSAVLAFLPGGFRERWKVRRIIRLPDPEDITTGATALDQVLHLPTGLRVAISTSPRGFSRAETPGGADRTATGLITISRGGSIITIADTLDSIADFAPSSTTVAIAPTGRIDHLASRLRVPTICINADQIHDREIDFGASSRDLPDARSLVRIFRDDVAEFRLHEDGVAIPAWRQTLAQR